MCMLNALAHQSSMQELDFMGPVLDPRISYTGGPKMFFGPAGLLQESRGNFITTSEDFTSGVWARNTGVTVAANVAQAPNGTMTADAVTYNGTGAAGSFRIYTTVLGSAPAGLQACSSVWLRSDTPITLRLSTNQSIRTYVVTSTWQRFDCPFAGNGIVNWQLAIYSPAGDNTPFTVYMWGAQAEKGSSTPGYYLPTSGSVAYEWPLEYDPNTLQPLGRSVWEQRTNLLLYSKDFTNAYWSPNVVTVTPNAAIALDGTMTACRVSGSNAFSQMVGTAFNVTGGQRHTISLYITPEQALGNWALRAYRAADQYAAVELDFSGATPTGVITEAGVAAASDFSIRRAGNGRWRVSLSFTPATSVAWTFRFYLNYGVAAVKSAIIEGAQAEAGAFATPLIPTSGSQVTRVRDVPDLTDIRSVRFNQAGGQTVVLEYQYENGNNYALMQVTDDDATLDNDWLIYSNNNPDGFIARMYSPSSAGNHFGGSFVSNRGTVNKGVVAADQAGTSGTLNGAALKSASNCIPPATGLLSARLGQTAAGSAPLNGYLRRIPFYPAKLSPAEMLALAA